MRSLIHLSDFILGLNLFLVVFTPASYFSPSPLVCHFCVKPRLYTGFSFPSFPIFFLFGDLYFASFLVCKFIVLICTLCTHSGSPGTFWVPIWFNRHNWCLSGPTLQTGLSDHQVQPVPFWFSLYFNPCTRFINFISCTSRTSRHLQGHTWGLPKYLCG